MEEFETLLTVIEKMPRILQMIIRWGLYWHIFPLAYLLLPIYDSNIWSKITNVYVIIAYIVAFLLSLFYPTSWKIYKDANKKEYNEKMQKMEKEYQEKLFKIGELKSVINLLYTERQKPYRKELENAWTKLHDDVNQI